jgi:gluconokinase
MANELARLHISLPPALPVQKDQLAPVDEMDQPQTKLREHFARRWPELNDIPWFPAPGDGACNNIGSGCTERGRYLLMVGRA